ncbi:DUF6263 family protein [Corynebacterium sp.]|uniref:DUF6263 family protein n=1 Tax=Corynebacterium sp. TaxID=1720 RepID=UPI002A91E401|nr:DUF6263 family protein [Corynebacterium sp.]MDY5785484.1 DUF6263 family protein [Corynebacterium sp.]
MITQRLVLPAAAAVGLAATLTACASGQDDPLEGITAFPVDSPDVRVIEQGTDPRMLTLSADAVSSEEWTTTVAVHNGFEQDIVAADSVSPTAPAGGNVDTISLPLAITAGTAPAPGDREQDAERAVLFRVEEPTHSSLPVSQDIGTADGFLMSWRTLLNGAVSTLKLLAPDGSTTTGRADVESALLTLASTTVVFPDEPIGVGGTWTVDNRVTGAAAFARTTTYEVESIEGDIVTLSVSVEERPTQRSLAIDNEAAGELNGQTLTVEDSSTTSEGRITVDLSKPIPTDGAVKATTRVIYTGPQSDIRIVQDITTAVEYGE